MGVTDIGAVTNQIKKYWSELFVPELRESHPLIALCSKDYQGQIQKGGDTVTVSQIISNEAQMKTIGEAGYNTFDSQAQQTRSVSITADKLITNAVEIDSIVELQSQLGDANSSIRESLMHGCMKKLNTYLYGLASPSTSSPDHVYTDSAIGRTELQKYRRLAAESHWVSKQRYGLISPQYWEAMGDDSELVSGDFAQDGVVVAGQSSMVRSGFNLFEDDSQTGKYGLFFTPDFLHLVMQMQPEFKLSDLHANKQHGYLLSVSFVVGAKLGIQGNLKHIETSA